MMKNKPKISKKVMALAEAHSRKASSFVGMSDLAIRAEIILAYASGYQKGKKDGFEHWQNKPRGTIQIWGV